MCAKECNRHSQWLPHTHARKPRDIHKKSIDISAQNRTILALRLYHTNSSNEDRTRKWQKRNCAFAAKLCVVAGETKQFLYHVCLLSGNFRVRFLLLFCRGVHQLSVKSMFNQWRDYSNNLTDNHGSLRESPSVLHNPDEWRMPVSASCNRTENEGLMSAAWFCSKICLLGFNGFLSHGFRIFLITELASSDTHKDHI